ncbi:presenilin family intramembrane aspartyl protease PSH [Natrialbaceae archaeon A-CW2]|uniref:presenilin family intramembrane aspartyl protease PSH n=1 Tax=Natronosalvus amylolyticus TaxID=2961994 RepID=UPI0020CA0881|nr:presenilin family intramembrane aspartyl protease PSH [Natronosalvus amylolyticus]
MNERARLLAAICGTCLLFIAVQLGSLTLIEPFTAADMQAVEDPQDPTYSLFYVGAILVMTAFMLAAFKYNLQWIIRALIIGVSVMLAWFVFAELFPPLVIVDGIGLFPLVAALAVGVGLLVYPEWYVIDVAGVVMGAGAAGLFGISFGLLPAIVLLVVLAVYDAISVYRTGHMLDLAEGVMDLRIPVLLVIPTSLSYSFLETPPMPDSSEPPEQEPSESSEQEPSEPSAPDSSEPAEPENETGATVDDESLEEDGELPAAEHPEGVRDALFIGLGDAVIPTILVASAATFIDEGMLEVPLITLNVPALGAIVGTLVGLLVLLSMVLQGRAHAGLPLLNTGAIGGYLIGALWAGVPLLTALGL